MRLSKADNLKAVQTIVTLPPSLMAHAKSLATSNTWASNIIASHILQGLTEKDFERAYCIVDVRSKRDPINKEFVRAARWICEGFITSKVSMDGILYFHVQWLKSEKENWVAIDPKGISSGFIHVIYDTVVTDPMTLEKLNQMPTHPRIVGVLYNSLLRTDADTLKGRVISAWINHWNNQERHEDAHSEVESRLAMETRLAEQERQNND